MSCEDVRVVWIGPVVLGVMLLVVVAAAYLLRKRAIEFYKRHEEQLNNLIASLTALFVTVRV